MSAPVQSIISTGIRGTIVDVQCHLSNNLPNIIIVGFANKAVDESRERIRGSFATSHIRLPRKRITINLAPADLPKADSSFDLAIAVSIMKAAGEVTLPLLPSQAFIGELGLDGTTRAVRGIIGKLLLGRSKGISQFFIPSANLEQAQLIPGITLVPISKLSELHDYLSLGLTLNTVFTDRGKLITQNTHTQASIQLSEVVGQQQAKRALEIAAAGGHNVLFSGPPGTGKSMLAKALPSILPPLNREEVLEVTHLHSLAGNDYEKIITQRPFRTPHHSASHVAIVGGGIKLRPGEISLAHRGVLFFDELPEFSRTTLEALRQPLEDKIINVARAKDIAEYPANFILIATANPCPCGYKGIGKLCKCLNSVVSRYQNRLSGPILDRIDLYCTVSEIDHDQLLMDSVQPASDDNVRLRVKSARMIQQKRYKSYSKLNSDMSNTDIKSCKLRLEAVNSLNQAAKQIDLSARAYMRIIKVARTIADLDQSHDVVGKHILEALTYRTKARGQL